ncbi:restriction endonuclease [Micromonospora palythoicola]|uniref:restriction endonuclease n=1 Tax=Micromonospora palythoicola TaxID=3120507 RepID=UPI002FCE58FC
MTEPSPQAIDSWEKAELNAAEWMRYWGFRDARVTNGGADSGVDVRSHEALAQVKYEAVQVGRPVLQRLVGARGRSAEKALFVFSGAGFTSHAVEYANDMDICLFKYTLAGSMKAENRTARDFLQRFEAQRAAVEQPRLAVRADSEQEETAAHARMLAGFSTGLRALEAKQVAAGVRTSAGVRTGRATPRGRVRLGFGIALLLGWVCMALALQSLGDAVVRIVWIGLSIVLIVSGIAALSRGTVED